MRGVGRSEQPQHVALREVELAAPDVDGDGAGDALDVVGACTEAHLDEEPGLVEVALGATSPGFYGMFRAGTGAPTTAGTSSFGLAAVDRDAAVAGVNTLYVADDRSPMSGRCAALDALRGRNLGARRDLQRGSHLGRPRRHGVGRRGTRSSRP